MARADYPANMHGRPDQRSQQRGWAESPGASTDEMDLLRNLIQRTGTIQDPFAQYLSVKFVAATLDLVRESKGESGVQQLIESVWRHHLAEADVPKDRFLSTIQDQHRWVHGEVVLAFIVRACLLLGRDDLFYHTGFRAVSDRSNRHVALAGPLGLYWLYRHVADVGKNLEEASDLFFDVKKSRPGRAVIRYRAKAFARESIQKAYGWLAPTVLRQWCLFSQGMLAAIPVLFGRPAAKVTETQCEGWGAPACEFIVEWSPASLWQRISAAVLGLSRKHRELLATLAQMEVFIRDRTNDLENAHRRALEQEQRVAQGRAELAMGKAYAASAAHDINNALGPARSGIEEILEALREARPLPRPVDSAEEAAEADFARRLGLVVNEKISEIVAAFDNVMDQFAKEEAEVLLDTFEYLARLAKTVQIAIPDIYRGINRASDFTAFLDEVASIDYAEEKKPVSLDRVVAQLTRKYKRPWEQRGIEMETCVKPDVVVMGWRRVFESVLSNLLDNAAQAVADSAEKKVRVVLTRAGERCVITVSDTGSGIPDHLLGKVFELGFTTRPAEGKGFGLGYVRNYVMLLGGDISVESRPGSPTSFELTFPLAVEGTP